MRQFGQRQFGQRQFALRQFHGAGAAVQPERPPGHGAGAAYSLRTIPWPKKRRRDTDDDVLLFLIRR